MKEMDKKDKYYGLFIFCMVACFFFGLNAVDSITCSCLLVITMVVTNQE